MNSTIPPPREREQRFREIYDAAYVDLLRYVRRRVHPTHAEDVVGEVMLVAWRRLDDVPPDVSAARAWLFGVARKTLQNTRRRDNRHEAVAIRLADIHHGPADAGQLPDLVSYRADIAAAWPLLSALHQEALALSVLDGLTAPEAAAVLGISSTSFRLRLSRARRTLRHHVDTMTTAALRDLDPAGPTVLTDVERERADATFARIMATPSHDHVPEESDRPRRRWARLLVPVSLVGAVVSALLLSGGAPAFASWTPKPEPLTGAAATEATTTCRAILPVSDQATPVVIAERRGKWTYVLMDGLTIQASCLMPNELIGQENPADQDTGFLANYNLDPVEAPTLAWDRIVQTGSEEGSVPTSGRLPFTTHKGYVTWVQGYVGSDVTGVTLHPPRGS
jgi:RNA polymerase sigma-70 factor, ECF subfamily